MQQIEAGQRQLPAYKSHKTVWALKIAQVVPKENPDPTGNSAAASYGARIVPADEGYAPFDVPAEYVTKHNPQVGGYYVVYADGYTSFSPAQAFEEGYAPILIMTQAESASLSRPGGTGEIGAAAKNNIAAISGVREFDIRAAGVDRAPRVTPADIEANIASQHYFTGSEGVLGNIVRKSGYLAAINSDAKDMRTLGLLTFCVLVLRNGTKIVGINYGPVSPENFDAEQGRREAHEDAVRQVWPLLGYELRSQLSKAARRHDPFAQWQPNA